MRIIRWLLNSIIFSAFLVCFQGCDKDEPTELEKLPPATQSGRRTFGCLVDGKAWVIEGITDVDGYYQMGTLFIAASVANNVIVQEIAIGLQDNNLTTQDYLLSDYPYGRLNDLRSNCDHRTSSNYSGKLTITHLDKTRSIISGTFAFEAYSSDCEKVVRITDGRFDIYYAP